MAIALRAVGARVKQDTAVSGINVAVPMPAGVVAGDLLLMFVLYDCNKNVTIPAGWSFSGGTRAAVGGGTFAPPTLAVYQRIATGSEGSTQTVTAPNFNWPDGNPNVLAFTIAYSGAEATSPVEVESFSSVAGNSSTAQAHPQVTTVTANGWLLTYRGRSGTVATYTDSVGTDVSRVQDSFNVLSCGLFDSNSVLSAGLQTQRTTTAGTAGDSDGDIMLTVALRLSSTAAVTNATARTAPVAAQAYNATAVVVNGPWDACGPGGLPAYTWAIDWSLAGETAAGNILSTNPYAVYDLTGWTGSNAVLARTTDLLDGRTLPTVLVVPNGVSASGGANLAHSAAGSIVPGQQYIADCWVYSPGGWADLRAAVDWYDASDMFLSSSLGVATVVLAGTWTHLRQTLTAPASSSRASVRARAGGTPASSNTFYVFGLVLMDPLVAEAQLAPSPLDMAGDDITSSGATWAYGRDQYRQTSPGALGTAAFDVTNVHRTYSPDRTDSPLYGDLDAARPMTGQVVFGSLVLPLFSGRIDNYSLTADMGDRHASFSFQDLQAAFQNTPVTTGLWNGLRTGTAVNMILDAVGWTGNRDVDLGATIMPWWWLDNAKAGDALNDLVKSEGPPSIFYIAPDGTAVFRDRTHRLLRDPSLISQGTFSSAQLGDCASPPATGLTFTAPFTYENGWRDIINTVNFQVSEREVQGTPSVVWSTGNLIPVSNGQTVTLSAVSSDPFIAAQVPVNGVDYTYTGAGTPVIVLGQTNGLSTTIMITASGADVLIQGIQLQACTVPVVRTVSVQLQDPVSVGQHGAQQGSDTSLPWSGAGDAAAIAEIILLRYAQRRPIVQLRVASKDPQHYLQVLQRTVSDLITIVNGETGTNSTFYVEHVAHTAQRMNTLGRPPVHAVVLGCEAQGTLASGNPIVFDQRGSGFDQGQFDPFVADDPTQVFLFDDPVQGVFDVGRLGT